MLLQPVLVNELHSQYAIVITDVNHKI